MFFLTFNIKKITRIVISFYYFSMIKIYFIMNRNAFFTVLLLFLCLFNLEAQNSDSNFWDSVRFGGGFNVGFGNNYTTVAISPSAIYDFSDAFSSGLSVSYLYSKNKAFNSTANVYGASAISLYNPFDRFQLSAEFEELNINLNNGVNNNSYWNPALYFGVAYRNGGVSVGLRYDVLYKENKSIYSSALTPVFRIYF